MSKELQERSERVMKELRDALIPISEAIKKMKHNNHPKKY